MKRIKIELIILIATFLFTSSCTNAQTSTHEKDLKYYTTIALQMEDFSNDSMLKIGKEAEKHKNGITTAADSLRYNNIDIFVSNITSEMDKRIQKLKQLENKVDDEYNLKETVLSFLISEKEAYKYNFGIYLKTMKNGEKSITDLEKAEGEKKIEKQKKLQNERKKIENLFLRYQIHYEITVNELKKYGL